MFTLDRLADAGALQGCSPAPAAAAAAAANASANPADTRNPVTTTSSVLALTYKDGVIMVADTTGAAGQGLGFRV